MDVKLVLRQGTDKPKVFKMKAAEMVVGRLKGCGLRVPSSAVSRKHCRLRVVDGLLKVEDLHSANGTLVNGKRVGSAFLKPGDQLKIGPVIFDVQYPLTPEGVDRLLAEESQPTPPRRAKKRSRQHDDDPTVAEVRLPPRAQPEPHADEEVEVGADEDVDEAVEIVPADEIVVEDVVEALAMMEEEADAVEADEEEADGEEVADEPPPKPKAPKKKKPRRRTKREPEDGENPDFSSVLGERALKLPSGEDLRDLLSELDEEDDD